MPNPNRVAYRPAQAAKAIGVSHRTIYNWLNDEHGPLESFKLGSSRMIWGDKLVAFLERRQGPAG